MRTTVRIGLLGDRSEDVRAHLAIPKALSLGGAKVGCTVEPVWLPTADVPTEVATLLAGLDALWCVPGSPYANMGGVLAAINFARTRKLPFLGTCGGFQHAVIEYARSELGLEDADHLESNPDSAVPIIHPLACSLVKVRSKIRFRPASRLAEIYGRPDATEEYQCSFGVNPEYRFALEAAGLRFTAEDLDGDARGIEIMGHPFFLGTLFQVELSALSGDFAHPLVTAFVRAAAG